MSIRSSKLKYLFVLLLFTACHSHDITLQVVTQTSDKLKCDKVFAEDRRSIIELNKILIQTGYLDDDDQPDEARVAIINVDNQEEVLKLQNTSAHGNKISEVYIGNNYQLTLKYERVVAQNQSVSYEGEAELLKGKLATQLSVTGLINHL